MLRLDWKMTVCLVTQGYDRWKRSSSNAYYDSPLVRRVVHNLEKLRHKDDADGIRAVLEVCLRSNFAGVESSRLYSETHFGEFGKGHPTMRPIHSLKVFCSRYQDSC